MKRKLLISLLMAVFAVGNVMADTTIKKYLLLSDASKQWNADKVTIDGNTFTFNAGTETVTTTDESGNETTSTKDAYGNADVEWSTITDISDCTNLVLKLEEASTSTVEIVVANGGFWGMDNNFSTTLAQGETEISIPIASMTKNGTTAADGSALDLTAINLIFLRTGWVHEQTIKIKEFYLEKTVTGDAKDYAEVDVTGGSAFEGSPSISGSVITFPTGGKWAYDVSDINSSLYEYLVIVPKRPYTTDMGKQLYDGTNDYSNWGLSYGSYQPRRANVINLKDKKTYAFKEETETSLDFSSQSIDCENLTKVYVKPENWSTETTFNISAIYFTNTCPTYDNRYNFAQADYIRETTDSLAWGTICLPYASAICGAQAYKVVGVDDKTNPSKIYLEEVNGVLQAGVPYIYQTNSTKNNTGNYTNGGGVFITKAGENTVAAPVSANNPLVGVFSETTVEEGCYGLASGTWKKSSGSATLGQYKAYLDLSKCSTVSVNQAPRFKSIGIGGDTTGIEDIEVATPQNEGDGVIYNMSGMRVTNPTKGIYIKNGKKFVVK